MKFGMQPNLLVQASSVHRCEPSKLMPNPKSLSTMSRAGPFVTAAGEEADADWKDQDDQATLGFPDNRNQMHQDLS